MPAREADHRRYAFGDFALDVDRGALSRAGVEVKLRPKSFEVLRYLVEHAGRLVGKDELINAVWGRVVVTDGSLTQCIIDIRRAVGDDGQRLIRTVPRRGFILDIPVSRPPPGEEPSAPRPAMPGIRRVAALAAVALFALAVVAWWMIAGRGTTDTADVAAQAPPPPPPNSIAVLRFADLSPAGDHTYFADGLAEEILHSLARSPDLRVTARGSSFRFEPGATDVAAIARELGAAHILEGSVRRAGDDLRVTTRLMDAGTRSVAWSRTYDRPFDGVLELQREIADDVARALKVVLAPTALPASPGAAQAQDLFLHGRYLFHRRAPGDLQAAERYLERAVVIDPTHARAWTALAGAYAVRGLEELRDSSYRIDEQRRALERALDLDPALAEAHVRLARYYSVVNAPAQSRAALERAYRLAPDDPLVLFTQSTNAILAGRLDEALALERRAVDVDPLSAVYRGNLGHTLLGAGRFEEALVELRRAQELVQLPDGYYDISRALLAMGRPDEARLAAREVPQGPHRDQLSILLDESPGRTEALERLRSDDSVRSLVLLAEVAAFEGDAATAFERLDAAALRLRTGGSADSDRSQRIEVMVSPFLRALHDDPRWKPLVASLAGP